ncbi:type IV secretory system conjugative DNA transfer family protein [Stenotrophomonas bentonitica]
MNLIERYKSMQQQNVGYEKYGMVILDGKGKLGGSLYNVVDYMLQPGKVKFAPIEGLDIDQIVMALWDVDTRKNEENDDYWQTNGRILADRTMQIWKPLYEAQQLLRDFYCNEYRRVHREIAILELEIEFAKSKGRNTSHIEDRLLALHQDASVVREFLTADEVVRWTVESIANTKDILVSAIDKNGKISTDMKKLLQEIGVEEYQFNPEAYKKRKAAGAIHPDLSRPGSFLLLAIKYWLKEFPAAPEETRGGYVNVFQTKLNLLMSNEKLCDEEGVPWHSIEKGVFQPEIVREGHSISIDMNDSIYGKSTQVITALVKQRVYKMIKSRAGKNWSETECQVIMIIDECHLVCGMEDADFASICREYGLAMFCSTQSVKSLIKALGSDNAAKLFLAQLLSAHYYPMDADGQAFVEQDVGQAKLIVTRSNTTGIDYDAAYADRMNFPLNDLDHPYASNFHELRQYANSKNMNGTAMKPGTGAVANRFTPKGEMPGLMEAVTTTSAPSFVERKKQPIAPMEEFGAYAAQGKPLLVLKRAGNKRMDYASNRRVTNDQLNDLFNEKNRLELGEYVYLETINGGVQ